MHYTDVVSKASADARSRRESKSQQSFGAFAYVVVGILAAIISAGVFSEPANAKGSSVCPANAQPRVLNLGSSGKIVLRLQKKLRVPGDGIFGASTAKAVKKFQARRGLPTDGIADLQTLSALKISATPLCPAHRGGHGRKRRGKSGARQQSRRRGNASPARKSQRTARRSRSHRSRGTQARLSQASTGGASFGTQSKWQVPGHLRPRLAAIAHCESGGNPGAVSRNRQFRGKYQFMSATWHAVGGKGDPASAPEREQDHRAALEPRAD